MIPRLLYAILFLFIYAACARQTSPNGGPKDLKPPKLLRSNPGPNERNFKGKILTFNFDEPIQVKNAKEEIIIAPSPGKDITFTAKQNRLIIELKQALADSTTYNINFREGVLDITEGTPPDNTRIAFSTGNALDTLSLQGRIVDAQKEIIPVKTTVAIYQSDTFDINKHTPIYFTKTNSSGRFVISNLKSGEYQLYAFEDKNKNLKLETSTEPFGFLPGHIHLSGPTDSLEIALLRLDTRTLRLSNVKHSDLYSTINFNKPITTYSITTTGTKPRTAFGTTQSEVKVYYPTNLTDSISIKFHAEDSLLQKVDTLVYIKQLKASSTPDKFIANIQPPEIDQETAIATSNLKFNKPIIAINYDSLYVRIDSLHILPYTPAELTYDSIHGTIRLIKQLEKKLIENPQNPLQFYSGTMAFLSIENDTTKQLQKTISIPKPEDTATLQLQIQTAKPDYIIQLLTPDYNIVRTSYNTPIITFNNLAPGDYKIRIVIDTNKNHQWDYGNPNQHIAPETTLFFQNADGKYQFPLRANWEVGPYLIQF